MGGQIIIIIIIITVTIGDRPEEGSKGERSEARQVARARGDIPARKPRGL